VAAKQLGGYIRGREEHGGFGLPPANILEASFIYGQKSPFQKFSISFYIL